jgi:hypothetical protein
MRWAHEVSSLTRQPDLSEAVRKAEMSEDAALRPVVIFMSYRRGDTQWAARGIYDRLVDRYGRQNVFRDLDAIPPGARFRDYVEKKISESDVLILLIGKAWASYADETGRRRLEQPRDPVRLELETALRLGLPIIPVRVEGALMPTEGELVPSIIDLLEFNAAEVTDSRWEYDVDRLLWAINETVEGRLRPSAPNSAGDREAEDLARREAEEQARREAEDLTRREAEEQARRDAEEQARRDAEEQARRDAEEQARRDAEEQARRDAKEQARLDAEEKSGQEAREKARQDAEERARRNAEAKARCEADEQACRDAEAQAGRDAEEAEHQARTDPQAREERGLAAASSPPEVVERVQPRSSGTADILSRRWAKILAAALAIGGLMVLISYLTSARPVETTIMSSLPDDLRARCTAADKAATCHLKDGTVVFYRLFDTVTEAKEEVSIGQPIEPISHPCPPRDPPAVVNTSVVCWYAVGTDKGLAMFGYIGKGTQSYFISRWVPNAEPLLRGEMSTKNAELQDWTTLRANWTRLVKAR